MTGATRILLEILFIVSFFCHQRGYWELTEGLDFHGMPYATWHCQLAKHIREEKIIDVLVGGASWLSVFLVPFHLPQCAPCAFCLVWFMLRHPSSPRPGLDTTQCPSLSSMSACSSPWLQCSLGRSTSDKSKLWIPHSALPCQVPWGLISIA